MNATDVTNIFTHVHHAAVNLNNEPFIPVPDKTEFLVRLHECTVALVELELATQKFVIKQKEIQLIESLMRMDFIRDDHRMKTSVKHAMQSAMQFWDSPPPAPVVLHHHPG